MQKSFIPFSQFDSSSQIHAKRGLTIAQASYLWSNSLPFWLNAVPPGFECFGLNTKKNSSKFLTVISYLEILCQTVSYRLSIWYRVFNVVKPKMIQT